MFYNYSIFNALYRQYCWFRFGRCFWGGLGNKRFYLPILLPCDAWKSFSYTTMASGCSSAVPKYSSWQFYIVILGCYGPVRSELWHCHQFNPIGCLLIIQKNFQPTPLIGVWYKSFRFLPSTIEFKYHLAVLISKLRTARCTWLKWSLSGPFWEVIGAVFGVGIKVWHV